MYGGDLFGSGGSGGIRGGGGGGGGGRMVVGGGDAFFAAATTQQCSPQKQFVPPQVVNVTYADLPLAHNDYMDYMKHIDAGLASKAWRRQTREREKNERANNNPFLGRKSKHYVTNLDVNGGKTKGQQTMTTGMIIPDLSLGLDGGKKEGQ